MLLDDIFEHHELVRTDIALENSQERFEEGKERIKSKMFDALVRKGFIKIVEYQDDERQYLYCRASFTGKEAKE